MRSPENLRRPKSYTNLSFHHQQLQHAELGSFTILPSEDEAPPPPLPLASHHYRISPQAKRRKSLAFSIIAEPNDGNDISPNNLLPTGRVSPFRGRGFHPPSRIPTRRGSACDKPPDIAPARPLHRQQSRSLSHLAPTSRPPASPRRPLNRNVIKRTPPFQPLSPIVGSSPECIESQSSPSKIPVSRSQPNSRMASPHRTTAPSRTVPKTTRSRDTSPSVQQPRKHYKDVPAKVNSFSKTPKVPKSNVPHKSRTTTTSSTTSSGSTDRTKPRKGGRTSGSQNSLNGSVGNIPSALVTNATKTVAQPLQIDPELVATPKIAPIVDGRVLSATSVSNAMSKMNESVMDSEALGIAKNPSPAKSIDPCDAKQQKASKAKDTDNKTITDPVTVTTTAEVKPEVKSTDTGTTIITTPSPKPASSGDQTDAPKIANHVSTTTITTSKILEKHVQDNMNKLTSPDNDTVAVVIAKNGTETIQRVPAVGTLVASEVTPIRITVKEKPTELNTQSANIVSVDDNTMLQSLPNGHSMSDSLAPARPTSTSGETEHKKENPLRRFVSSVRNKIPSNCFQTPKSTQGNDDTVANSEPDAEKANWLCCLKRKQSHVTINISENNTEAKPPTFWEKLSCCRTNKISDSDATTSCFSRGKRKGSSDITKLTSDEPVTSRWRPNCSKDCCKSFLRKIFCVEACRRKKAPVTTLPVETIAAGRRASMVPGKKKSITPSLPLEDRANKLDPSLVDQTSHMKAAIPVLPVWLAWFCLVMNCIGPGTGTVLSGLFCLCIGIPRFSQKDGPRPRIGSFIINAIIGFGQFFTVLFCLVGWGWSIWWGVIMLRIAKKHRRIKNIKATASKGRRGSTIPNKENLHGGGRDVERGH